MAFDISFELAELPAGTYWGEIYPRVVGGGAIENGLGGDSITSAGDGWYQFTVSQSITGRKLVRVVDGDGTVWSKFFTNITGDAAEYGEEEAATYEQVSDIDVSPVVNVSPSTAEAYQRPEAALVNAYLGETDTMTVYSVTGADGEPYDLSAVTLKLVIERLDGRDVQVVDDGDLTVSGTDSNNFAWAPAADVVSSVRPLRLTLWNVISETKQRAIVTGDLAVHVAAVEDES